MKPIKIKYHSDPAHGWYSVKFEVVKQLGIENSISSCSYVRGKTIYLEEDSDASKLFQALTLNSIPNEVELMKPSEKPQRLRSYARYQGGSL